MPHLSNVRRALSFATAMTAVACLTPSAALATEPSSTIYPEHKTADTVSLGSSQVYVHTNSFYTSQYCTLSGGSFSIPATGSKGGPTTVTFTTLPSFTACKATTEHGNNPQIITRGTWKLTAQYGLADITITVPANGLEVIEGGKTVWFSNEKAAEFVGGWTNGFTAPFAQASVLYWGGAIYSSRNQSFTIGGPSALDTITDTTHPEELVLLGT